MSKNIIKTIKIDIAGTEVEVTPEQAKQLHAALAGLLGLDKPAKVIEKEVVRDRYYPYRPFYYQTGTIDTSNQPFKIWYSSADSSARLQIN